jgi:hypothetical protein
MSYSEEWRQLLHHWFTGAALSPLALHGGLSMQAYVSSIYWPQLEFQ